jgi:hypothetical protein
MNSNSFITLTFGDCAENHVGMQKIGKICDTGFNFEDLTMFKEKMEGLECDCELIKLNLDEIVAEDAYVLIVRDGVNKILKTGSGWNKNDLFEEQLNLNVDKHALMYGRVVNKHARWNLCFDFESQEPDYKNGKGRIISFNDVPITKYFYDQLPICFGDKAQNLKIEGNYYFNTEKCGIGFHGDAERKKVIGVRLGENSQPLHFQWFKNLKPVGERIILNINDGDIYFMSEKTVGYDWKSSKNYTLRHATGANKFITI